LNPNGRPAEVEPDVQNEAETELVRVRLGEASETHVKTTLRQFFL